VSFWEVIVAVATHYKDRRDGLWNKCKACNEFVFKPALARNFHICPSCNYYFPMPAVCRLHHLLDSNPLTELYPLSLSTPQLDTLELTDLVSRTVFPETAPTQAESKTTRQFIAAVEGEISGQPIILAVGHPYAIPQRVHFVTLLVAVRSALQKELPLITVYPSNALPKLRQTDRPIQSELSFAEITYLKIEMERLSKACLPHLTVLTETNVDGELSTKYPLGEVVLAEQARVDKGKANPVGKSIPVAQSQSDVFVDCYVQRQDLPTMLGKLLKFFTPHTP
jgi:acetyl-CoA carboxylase beta subunit